MPPVFRSGKRGRKKFKKFHKPTNKNETVHVLPIITDLHPPNFIQIAVQNTPVWALVDTGAQISVMSENLLQKLKNVQRRQILPSSCAKVSTADGKPLNITKRFRTKITIGNRKAGITAHVASKLQYDFIIGADFLHDHRAEINYAKKKLILHDTFKLKTVQNITIQPHTEMVFPVKCKANIPDNITGITSGVNTLVHLGAITAKCVTVSSNSTVPIRVLNPTNHSINIPKGTRVGTFNRLKPHETIHLPSNTDPAYPIKPTQTTHQRPQIDLSNSQLSEQQKQQLNDLLDTYSDVFVGSDGRLGHCSKISHTITLEPNTRPVKHAPYRTGPVQTQAIEDQMDDYLIQNIISESNSPWAAPIVLVRKKDSSYRFTCDYRSLNLSTIPDAYPLPKPADCLDFLGTNKPAFFSTLDLASGYFQMAIDEQSRDLTAFTVAGREIFQWNRLPMGLKNSAASFQRLMESVLRGLNWKTCLIYLDDIVIFSPTFEDHLQHISQVFDRLREANLKLKPKKCHFACPQVNYLGHIVSANGIAADPKKLEVVKNFPIPTNIKELRSFLGLTNYYRKFCKGYSQTAEPLINLTKKDVPFKWSPACQSAFDKLKTGLCSPPILGYPQFNKPFNIYTDASTEGLGVVLAQPDDQGIERVIAYGGRALNRHEKRYHITELEALAIVYAVKLYDGYLRHNTFTVYTDHIALKSLLTMKNPSNRLARWIAFLNQFDHTILYKPGKNHNNADALSRRPYPEPEPIRDDEDSLFSGEDNPRDPVNVTMGNPPTLAPIDANIELNQNSLKRFQRNEPQFSDIITYIENGTLPSQTAKARQITKQSDDYYMDQGILYHLWIRPAKGKQPEKMTSQLAVPNQLRQFVLSQLHDTVLGGHMGYEKVYMQARLRYYWPGMAMDIRRWVDSCPDCLARKRPVQSTRAPLYPIPPGTAFSRIGLDATGPMHITKSKNRYILLFVDYLTKWVEAVPVPNITAKTVAHVFMDHVIAKHGAPQILQSDRGTNFLSQVISELCKGLEIQHIAIPPYTPHIMGQVERMNHTIKNRLAIFCNDHQDNWDTLLPCALAGYHMAPHSSTGFSPFETLYGRQPVLPLETQLQIPTTLPPTAKDTLREIQDKMLITQRLARQNILESQRKMKKLYDKSAHDPNFQIGDIVYMEKHCTQPGFSKKLRPRYTGPLTIVRFHNPVTVQLRETFSHILIPTPIHVNRLKKGKIRGAIPNRPRPISPSSNTNDSPGPSSSDSGQSTTSESDPEPSGNATDSSHNPTIVDDHTSPLETRIGMSESDTISDSSQSDRENGNNLNLGQKQTPVITDTVESDSSSTQNQSETTLKEKVNSPSTGSENEASNTQAGASNTDELFQFEKFIRGRYKNGTQQYLVKWVGYPHSQNSWVARKDMNELALQILNKSNIKMSGRPPKTHQKL